MSLAKLMVNREDCNGCAERLGTNLKKLLPVLEAGGAFY
jgi:hypothetical protein